MALKKGMFESYVKEREVPITPSKTTGDTSKYSHNRVFDEPESLKKVQLNQEKDKKDLESEFISATTYSSNESIISNQLAINKEPISNQLVTNKKSISNQALKNKITRNSNKEPISNPISNRHKEPISNPLVTQLVTIQDSVAKTSGLQRKILFYIVEDCIYRGKLVSGFITNETLREITNANADTVKTATQRLINKGLIKREQGQRGKGGFSSFIITEETREAVLKEKRNPSISNQLVTHQVTNISNPLVTNKEPNKEPSTSSSSSALNLKETTTTGEEWNFDINPYARFGFTTSQLKQLTSLGVISAADVEQSLIEFSFDLDNNTLPPIKTTKVNYLMGLFRKGVSHTSEGYRNEQDAMISEMARRSEAKRKNLLEEKFAAWEAELNDEERMQIENKLPTHLMSLHRAYGLSNVEVRNWLFNYYLQKGIN